MNHLFSRSAQPQLGLQKVTEFCYQTQSGDPVIYGQHLKSLGNLVLFSIPLNKSLFLSDGVISHKIAGPYIYLSILLTASS